MRPLYRVWGIRRFTLAAQRLVFRVVNARFCDGAVTLYGWPIISAAEGSVLKLHDGVRLVSDAYFSGPGIGGPCVLRTLASGAVLDIGQGTGLSGVGICALREVRVGADCLIGADVIITDNDFHPLDPSRRMAPLSAVDAQPVRIGRNVFVGARAIVLKGVTVGDDSVVAAGAVVTSDVMCGQIVAGVPARAVGWVAGYGGNVEGERA